MWNFIVQPDKIQVDPTVFNANADFFSEAWGISPNGGYVVGTAGQTPRGTPTRPNPNLESGDFHGLTHNIDTQVVNRIDVPNAAATSIVGCNDQHDIVGFFRNTQNELHGFVWLDGQALPTTFDVTSSLPVKVIDDDPFIHNAVFGINNQRLVVGTFNDVTLTNHDPARAGRCIGFVAHADDPRTRLRIDMKQELRDAPGIDTTQIDSTKISGINRQGDIVGSYRMIDKTSFPFKWSVRVTSNNTLRLVGNVALLNHPGRDVVATGINDSGHIVGTDNAQNDPNIQVHGFIWYPDTLGNYNPDDYHLWQLDVTSLLPAGRVQKSFVNAIDSSGKIVGSYRVDAGNPQLNRRAFIGVVPSGVRWWGPLDPIPFFPPTPNPPFPLPPFPWWSFPLFGGGGPQTQDTAVALILM